MFKSLFIVLFLFFLQTYSFSQEKEVKITNFLKDTISINEWKQFLNNNIELQTKWDIYPDKIINTNIAYINKPLSNVDVFLTDYKNNIIWKTKTNYLGNAFLQVMLLKKQKEPFSITLKHDNFNKEIENILPNEIININIIDSLNFIEKYNFICLSNDLNDTIKISNDSIDFKTINYNNDLFSALNNSINIFNINKNELNLLLIKTPSNIKFSSKNKSLFHELLVKYAEKGIMIVPIINNEIDEQEKFILYSLSVITNSFSIELQQKNIDLISFLTNIIKNS